MNKDAYDVFDKLPDLENALSKGPKMSLFYIAGYIIRKDDCSSDDALLIIPTFTIKRMAIFV